MEYNIQVFIDFLLHHKRKQEHKRTLKFVFIMRK